MREFLSHYAMIVLSILTALGLEQVALGIEHRHEGARAKEEIEQEIAANRKEVEDALARTRRYLADWQAMLTRTAADMKAGQSTNESRLATIHDAGHKFGDATPALKMTAWDAAVADHAVNYLDHADLTRYSETYALQRSFSQAVWDTVRDSASRNLSELSLPAYTGIADPLPTLSLLNSRVRALALMESQLQQIDQALKGSMPDHPSAPSP